MQSIRELSVKALEKYVVVTLQIGYWSGEKKIDLKDITTDDLGPLVKGLLKIDNVKDIASVDRRARYTLDQFSIQFGPLKLVPEKRLQALLDELNQIKGSFVIVSEQIKKAYPDKLQDIKEKYPHLAEAIGKYFPSDIADKFYFKWNLLRIIPQTQDDTEALSQTLIDANINNFEDVKAWLNKIKEKGELNNRTIKTLQNAVDKAFDNQINEDSDILEGVRTIIYNGGTEIDPVLVDRAIETIDEGITELKEGTVKIKDTEPVTVERG